MVGFMKPNVELVAGDTDADKEVEVAAVAAGGVNENADGADIVRLLVSDSAGTFDVFVLVVHVNVGGVAVKVDARLVLLATPAG